MNKKDVQGITLIALVVTIIVLLILSVVAINLSIGSNGIFTRAGNAVDKYKLAENKEKEELDKASNFINDYTNIKEDNNIKVEGVTIPKGFYYVGGTKETGIIISDNKYDENKYSKEKCEDQANIPGDGLVGNQFVWIPVENEKDFKRYPSYYNGEASQSVSYFSEPSNNGYTSEEEEYNRMYQSVKNNKGFYVARYEAGEENGKVVSKKGAAVIVNIPWGESMTEIGENGAVAKAQGMYTNKETHNVTSTLIYGVQWDAIMAWIDPAYNTSSCDIENSFVANSTNKGNHTGNIVECGSNDLYRVKNIYDLAGNAREWSMESLSDSDRGDRIHRGGGGGTISPTSNREVNQANMPSDRIGFRVALYI